MKKLTHSIQATKNQSIMQLTLAVVRTCHHKGRLSCRSPWEGVGGGPWEGVCVDPWGEGACGHRSHNGHRGPYRLVHVAWVEVVGGGQGLQQVAEVGGHASHSHHSNRFSLVVLGEEVLGVGVHTGHPLGVCDRMVLVDPSHGPS